MRPMRVGAPPVSAKQGRELPEEDDLENKQVGHEYGFLHIPITVVRIPGKRNDD